jgi:hypothetical protein
MGKLVRAPTHPFAGNDEELVTLVWDEEGTVIAVRVRGRERVAFILYSKLVGHVEHRSDDLIS